jgi:hypothetical protein
MDVTRQLSASELITEASATDFDMQPVMAVVDGAFAPSCPE